MRPDSTDPQAWLARAKSNLALAAAGPIAPEVYLEDLCFEAQQAAEKALKALLIAHNVPFPRTHAIELLLSLVQTHVLEPPPGVLEATRLTPYGTLGRYPGEDDPVTEDEYQEALELARRVVAWVEAQMAC